MNDLINYFKVIPKEYYIGIAGIAISVGCWIGSLYVAARSEKSQTISEPKTRYDSRPIEEIRQEIRSKGLEQTFKTFDGLEQKINTWSKGELEIVFLEKWKEEL